MLNFNEFLIENEELVTEAGERMTKLKWQSAMDILPHADRKDFMKYAASVQKLYGIGTSNPKDYYKVQNAFKSLTGAAVDKAPKAPKTKEAIPVATPKVAPKASPAPEKTPAKEVPGMKVFSNGKYGTVIGSSELRTAIDAVIPMLRDNATLYKAMETYLDNLEDFYKSQGRKATNSDYKHVGEIKVLMTKLRFHLAELSKQTGLSYTI